MASGGYKGASPARETSPEQYPGVWELTEQFQAQADGNWPFQPDDCAPKSLRLGSELNGSLTRDFPVQGDRRTWTWAAWVKRSKLAAKQQIFGVTGTSNSTYSEIYFASDDKLRIRFGYHSVGEVRTAQVFRDPTAWLHICIAFDRNQSADVDKLKLYINGEEFTDFDLDTRNNFASEGGIGHDAVHRISGEPNATGSYLSAYLAEVHFIDGQALTPDVFTFIDGQGILQPKRFTGDYSSGPVYSNHTVIFGGGSNSSYPLHQGFNGNLSDRFEGDTSGSYVDIPYEATVSSGSVEVYVAVTSSQPVVVTLFNGSSQVATGSSGSSGSQWHAPTTYAGPITKIRIARTGRAPEFNAVRVNGVILTDASVGRNSFHLDFSDGVKDQSGLGNDWTAHNLNLGGDFTYSSAHGSNVTTAEFAKMVDSDLNTYGEPNGDFIGFAFANQKISLKIQNTAQTAKTFYIQPATNTSFNFVNGGTWSVSGGSASGNQWTINANSTETGTFTVPSNYAGTGRIYFSGSSADFRIYDISLGVTQDISVDSPVNGNEASTGAGNERRGNYCTWNPVDQVNATLSNGNLHCSLPAHGSNFTRGTFSVTSGKWFWEVTLHSGVHGMIGISDQHYVNGGTQISYAHGVLHYYVANGDIYGDVGRTGGIQSSYGSSLAAGDILGVALDMDNGNVKFYKNGTAFTGNANTSSLVGKTISPCIGEGGGAMTTSTNFGQSSFIYTPPAGYSPLATSFLPEPTIKRGDEAMDAALWTGNGATQTIGNFRISPDLVWIKRRNTNGDHQLYDTLRGVNKGLSTNLTAMQWEYAGGLSSFNSDGFTIGSLGGANGDSDTHVGWVWDAGESTTTIGIGDLNSSAYDQSQTWSSSLTSTQTFNLATTRAFDGDATNSTLAATANATNANILFTKTFTGVTKLRVYMDHDYQNYRVRINGGTWHTDSTLGATANAGWRDLTSIIPANGTVNSIESDTGGQNNGVNWSAVEVNGRLLVDASPALGKTLTSFRAKTDWNWHRISAVKVNGTILTTGTLDNTSVWTDPDEWKDGNADSNNATYSQAARGVYFKVTLASGIANFSELQFFMQLDSAAGTTTNIYEIELTFSDGTTHTKVYAANSDAPNQSGAGFNSWQWQNFGHLGINPPSVPSTAADVRARPDAGFSLVSWQAQASAATVPHGLGKKPHFIVMKSRNHNNSPWLIYHKDLGSSHYLDFHSAAPTSNNLVFTDEPTSVAFSPGNGIVNSSVYGQMIAYCWSEVNDYSKFTSFTGTGGDVFVYLGFKPRLIWFKNANSAANWLCYDTARNRFNPENFSFQLDEPNTDTAVNNDIVDILSNGFNVKATRADLTGTGNQILIAAWAEHPFASNTRAR